MSARTSRPTRIEGGALVGIVAVLAVLVLMIGTATALVRSGTDRTLGRTAESRQLVEAGEAASAEAVAAVRASMDRGRALPPATLDDWRSLTLSPSGTSSHKVPPRLVRATYRDLASGAVDIGDVEVQVEARPSGTIPQGVLNTRVTITSGSSLFPVTRTVVERRAYYVTGTVITVLPDPLAVEIR